MRHSFPVLAIGIGMLIVASAVPSAGAQVTITNTNTNSAGGSWSGGYDGANSYYYYNSYRPVYTYPSSSYIRPIPSLIYGGQPMTGVYPQYYLNTPYIGNGCTTYGTFSRYATIASGCTCTTGYEWDRAGLQCVPKAQRLTYRDIDTGCWRYDGRRATYPDPACSCGNGMQWNEYRQCVPVPYDYCATYDVHAQWNADEQACVCQGGYRASGDGRTCFYDGSDYRTTSSSIWQRKLRY